MLVGEEGRGGMRCKDSGRGLGGLGVCVVGRGCEVVRREVDAKNLGEGRRM